MKLAFICVFYSLLFLGCQVDNSEFTSQTRFSSHSYRTLSDDESTFRDLLFDLCELSYEANAKLVRLGQDSIINNYTAYTNYLLDENIDVEAIESLIEDSHLPGYNLYSNLSENEFLAIYSSEFQNYMVSVELWPDYHYSILPCFGAYLADYAAAFEEYEVDLYASLLMLDMTGVVQAGASLMVRISNARDKFFDCVG